LSSVLLTWWQRRIWLLGDPYSGPLNHDLIINKNSLEKYREERRQGKGMKEWRGGEKHKHNIVKSI
jgi:hypothetical protein